MQSEDQPSGPTGEEVRRSEGSVGRWRRRVHWWAAVLATAVFGLSWAGATDNPWAGALFGLVWYAIINTAGSVRETQHAYDQLLLDVAALRSRCYGLEVLVGRVERRGDRHLTLAEQQTQVCAELVRRVGTLEHYAELQQVPEVDVATTHEQLARQVAGLARTVADLARDVRGGPRG